MQHESDKIPLYSCLVWLYIRQVREAPNKVSAEMAAKGLKSKSDYHALATSFANKAFLLDKTWSVNILARGALSGVIGKFDSGLSSYDSILTQSGNTNLFANLGKARFLYHKKNYRGALKLYQDVLRSRVNFVPDPRIGIGLCFWHLNQKTMALAAWERALELQPESASVNTLLGLYWMDEAVKNVHGEYFADNYKKAINYTQDAYKQNPNYPAADLVLANYLFSKKDTSSVLKLSQRAIAYSDVPTVISEAYFWIGRAHHNMNDFEEALKHYKLAEQHNKANILPRIGKGLVEMAQGSPEALLTFESVVADHPKSTEALFLLALLYVQRSKHDRQKKTQAVSHLEKFMRLCKEQDESPPIEALLTLSKLTEEKNATTSLNTLTEVIQLLTLQDVPVYPELFNNIGVLHYGKGSYDSARTFFEQALEAAKENPVKSEIKITIDYNIARLEDARGNTELALKLYGEVLELWPDYLDARIRTTYLALALGQEDAVDKMKQLMSEHGDNLEVRALHGWHLRRTKRPPAKNVSEDVEQKHYKHSLVDHNKHDTYSLVGLGNLYLSIAREIRINGAGDAEKKEKTYFKAAEFFDKALQIDSSNAYAAQGVAIILAETKRAEAALHIFGKVRETLNDVSIYINTGDCLVELKDYSKAIESYEIAQHRFGRDNDSQLMTLLGRAWYARGMREKNLEALRQALSYSEKASNLSKDNMAFKFNVAFVKFQLAGFVQKTPENTRTIEDIEVVTKGLNEAIESLNEISKSRYPPYPPKDLEQRALMGQNTMLKQLERALSAQKEFESKTQDKLALGLKLREVQKAKIEEEQRRKNAAEEERQRELDEERRQLQAQAREWTDAQMAETMENEKLHEERKEAKKRMPKEKRERSSKNGEKGSNGKSTSASSSSSKKKKTFKSTSDVESSDFESEVEDKSGAGLFSEGEEEESARETDDEKGDDGVVGVASPKRAASVDGSGGDEPAAKKRRIAKIVDDEDDEDDDGDDGGEEKNGSVAADVAAVASAGVENDDQEMVE